MRSSIRLNLRCTCKHNVQIEKENKFSKQVAGELEDEENRASLDPCCSAGCRADGGLRPTRCACGRVGAGRGWRPIAAPRGGGGTWCRAAAAPPSSALFVRAGCGVQRTQARRTATPSYHQQRQATAPRRTQGGWQLACGVDEGGVDY